MEGNLSMLEKYLKWIMEHDGVDESIFPIDSVHTGKPFLKYVIGENFDEDEKRVLIDFDGVIHKYSSGWSEGLIYDEPISGAREAVIRLKNAGYKVFIFTSRLSKITLGKQGSKTQKQMIEKWLDENDIEVDGIIGDKIPAEVYIDDRAIRFEGIWNNKFYEKIIYAINKNNIK